MLTYPRNRAWKACATALSQAGIRLGYTNNTPDFDEQAAQAIINAADVLPEYKDERVAAIKAEGLARIQAVLPAIDSFDALELAREQWLSIAPAARTPTAAWTSVINIYTAGRNAAILVRAAANLTAVDAVTPAWP